MKKTMLVAAATIITLLIVGVFSLNYFLTANTQVEITSFNTAGTSSGSSIGVVNVWFVLNISNTGIGDTKDLAVTFGSNTTVNTNQQVVYTYSTAPYEKIAEFQMGESCLLGNLKAGETREARFYWAVSVDFYSTSLCATLKSNEATLDHAILAIPPIPNVRITNFVCTGIWGNSRLGSDLDLFSLSYTNFGTIDVMNLTITLNAVKTNESDRNTLPSPYRYLDEYINGHIYHLEDIKGNETKIFKKGYLTSLYYLKVEPFVLTATLKSNGTFLDQATVTVPITDSIRDSISDEYIA